MVLLAAGLCLLLMPVEALAHDVTGAAKSYIQEVSGVLLIPFAYRGAKHTVTGTITCCSCWASSSFYTG